MCAHGFAPNKIETTVNLEYPTICQTWIVGKGGLWLTLFMYKNKTSTTYPLYETMQTFCTNK